MYREFFFVLSTIHTDHVSLYSAAILLFHRVEQKVKLPRRGDKTKKKQTLTHWVTFNESSTGIAQ